MTRRLFGTDGVRGLANREPMTAETATRLAMAAAAHFRRGDHRHRVLIGKDTRLSGYLLEPALAAGFISMGFDVLMVGPVPTPGVAMLARSLRADLGVMISASHNPYADNGIKLFGPDGWKLSDEAELAIEALLGGDLAALRVAPDALGRATRLEDGAGRYVEFVKASFPRGQNLEGLSVVVDCAHGAAYKAAPAALWELGARVIPLGVTPNGKNINENCGAMYPQTLAEAVVVHQADLGIALDGDADRLILVDELGQVIDGDQVLGLIARDWHAAARLRGGGVVGTQMTNLGLERLLLSMGLSLIRAKVGDRYVVEQMQALGCNLGGESSGHIVLTDYATTGDGLMAALQVLAVLRQAALPASTALRVFTPVPQLLRSVPVDGRVLETPPVQAALAAAEAALVGQGRLLVRKSGTEPVVRVMAEGDDAALVARTVETLCITLRAAG